MADEIWPGYNPDISKLQPDQREQFEKDRLEQQAKENEVNLQRALRLPEGKTVDPINIDDFEGKALGIIGGVVTPIEPGGETGLEAKLPTLTWEGEFSVTKSDPVTAKVGLKKPDPTNPIEEDSKRLALAMERLDGVVGQVKSIDDLRNFEPILDGQVVTVTAYYADWALAAKPPGGGRFTYDKADTTTADDGGHCIVTAGGKRWKRVGELLLEHYGIQPYVADNPIDYGDTVNKYLAACVRVKQSWANFKVGTYIFIKQEIRVPDYVVRLISDKANTFKANPDNFTALAGTTGLGAMKFMMSWGDRTLPDNQGRQGSNCIDGTIACEWTKRATEAQGLTFGFYAKAMWMQIGHLRAFNARGNGVWIDSVWDSTITRISVEVCGCEDSNSPQTYALRLSGNTHTTGTDTFNATKINSIQVEQAVGHGLYIGQTVRCEIENLHMERMTITKVQDSTNGYGHVIVCGNSVLGQATVDRAPITNPPNNPDNVAQIETPMVVSIGGNNSVVTGWLVSGNVRVPESYGSVFNGLNAENLFCPSPASGHTFVGCTITYLTTIENRISLVNHRSGYTLQGVSKYQAAGADPVANPEVQAGLRLYINSQDCVIKGGRIAKVYGSDDTIGGNKFFGVTIDEQVERISRPKAASFQTPYTYVPVTTNTSTAASNNVGAIGIKEPTTFIDCNFYGGNDELAAGTDATVAPAVAAKPAIVGHGSGHIVIKGGFVRSVAPVANALIELLDNVTVGKITMQPEATNALRTHGVMCRDVTGFALPLGSTFPVGTLLTRCGAAPAAGSGIVYVNVDGGRTAASWKAIVSA